MHLVLCPDSLFDDAAAVSRLVARLRRAGVAVGWRIAVPDDGRAPLDRPDFVLVPSPEIGSEAFRPARIVTHSRAYVQRVW